MEAAGSEEEGGPGAVRVALEPRQEEGAARLRTAGVTEHVMADESAVSADRMRDAWFREEGSYDHQWEHEHTGAGGDELN